MNSFSFSSMRQSLLLGIIAPLCACGAMTDRQVADSGTSATTPTDDTGGIPTNEALQGFWDSDCNEKGSFYEKVTLLFSAFGMTRTTTLYSAAGCDELNKTFVMKIGTRFELGAQVDTPTGAFAINHTYLTASITPYGYTMTTQLNSTKLCNVTGWSSGEETDVMDRTCVLPTGETFAQSVNDLLYDIYEIQDNTLSVGLFDYQPHATEDKRVAEFDSRVLSKRYQE